MNRLIEMCIVKYRTTITGSPSTFERSGDFFPFKFFGSASWYGLMEIIITTFIR